MGAFDHLEWTYDGAFEQLFGLGRGEFEQKFSKNSNARGVARGGMLKLRFDWYISTMHCRRFNDWSATTNDKYQFQFPTTKTTWFLWKVNWSTWLELGTNKKTWVLFQSNLRLRPPLFSEQFSKIPKVSQSNHYIRNLLYATTSRKRPRPLLKLKLWNFPMFLTSHKRSHIGLSRFCSTTFQ